MDVSLEKDSLLKIIQNAQRALSSKSTLPVLNGIFLGTEEGSLYAYSTDLEIAIRDQSKASVQREGKAVVFGNLLVDLVKNLDEGKINLLFNQQENKLVVSTNKSRFILNTLPVEDYPSFPKIEEGSSKKIKNTQFIEAIRQVVISSSKDESRPILTGVLFGTREDKSQIVATDSYRLSIKEVKNLKGSSENSMVIPRRAIEEIIKTIPKEGEIEMIFSEKQVVFKGETLVMISRLIGGQYPKYEQLFPKSFEIEAIINKEELLQSAKRMALLSPTTPIILQIDGEKMIVSNKSADVGSGQETIKVGGKLKNIEAAFNSRYLIDGLSVVDDEQINLNLVDSFQPGLISGTKSKDFTYLIMPVRLN